MSLGTASVRDHRVRFGFDGSISDDPVRGEWFGSRDGSRFGSRVSPGDRGGAMNNRFAYYNVTTVVDDGYLSTTVCLPYRDDDDSAYDGDDSAVDMAVALWRDEYGFDLSRVRLRDVVVELQGVE